MRSIPIGEALSSDSGVSHTFEPHFAKEYPKMQEINGLSSRFLRYFRYNDPVQTLFDQKA
jgi:hypothetical protein